MIEWMDPLETIDGVPMKLADTWPQPDKVGRYALTRMHGGDVSLFRRNGSQWLCDMTPVIRNRQPVQSTERTRYIINGCEWQDTGEPIRQTAAGVRYVTLTNKIVERALFELDRVAGCRVVPETPPTLHIELSGPQGCGKTRVHGLLAQLLAEAGIAATVVERQS